MDFVCELSVENRIAVPVKVTNSYEVYSGYFGKKMRLLKPLDPALVTIIKRLGIRYLEFLPLWVESDLDLRLLQDIPELEVVSIHAEVPLDWTPLQRLTTLKKLRLKARHFRPQPLDFCAFKSLHSADITWHSEWSSVLRCASLRRLEIEGTQKLHEFDFRELPRLVEVSIRECKGLKRLLFAPRQRIESFAITASTALEKVEPLSILKCLKYLAIAGHSKLDIRFVKDCRALRKLWINGMGKIPSLDFLASCKNLEYLQMLFSTNVQDGNLDILLKLPRLKAARFEDRAHYSHSVTKLNELIGR